MKVPYSQRVAGNLMGGAIVLVTLGSLFAPIADPGGRMAVAGIGLLAALGGAGLFGWIIKSASGPALEGRARYLFGAFTQFEHGTVGTGQAAFRAGGLLLPLAAWIYLASQSL